jgi:signal transduction histidine kinase
LPASPRSRRQIATAIYNARLYQRSLIQGVDLERANKVKSDFLGVVSHELKTPVTMIIGYTSMVKERSLGPLSDDQERALMAVEGYSHDLLKVVNNILQATVIESQTLSVASEEFRLDRLFADLRSEFARNFEGDLALDWDAGRESPVMHTDYEKVKQILRHLIDTAVKFSGNDRVKLSACYQTENDRIEFQVADSGVGIPKENRSTIFEKFFQIDSTSARTYGGVGLGLYITKRFTELLGGKIDLDSEREGGATFIVRLPCHYSIPAAQA